MSEAEVIRLFIAVPVPATIRDALRAIQRELQTQLQSASIRWMPTEQMHLTLRFLGNVELDQLGPLQTALQSACVTSPALNLQAFGLGIFPARRTPRVIWAGVRDRDNHLHDVQKAVQIATSEFGEKPEAREFSAHLTLGRVKEIGRAEEHALREFVASHASRTCGEWTVQEIELVRSHLGPAGAEHSALSQYRLSSNLQ